MGQRGFTPTKTYLVAAGKERREMRLNFIRAREASTGRGLVEVRRWTISSGTFAVLPFAKRPRQMRRYGRWGTAGPL
jgi:hypothetical protein